MGQKLNGADAKTLAPGPGAYDQEKQKKANLQYSMGAKIMDLKSMNVPGPGTYEKPKANIESVKSMKFGTGQRSKMESSTAKVNPGPGEHQPDYKVGRDAAPKYGFGSETRNTNADLKKTTPGPGNYSLGSLIGEGRKNTMHSTIGYSPEKKENSFKPGPGNYDPKPLSVKRQEPQYKLGSGTRFDLGFQKRQLFQQDPGSYDPDYKKTKSASAQWGFGTDKRKGLVNRDQPNFPGAGSYQIASRISEGPKYGVGAKLKDQNRNVNPGPGTYDL